MPPFLEFRLWLREGPLGERVLGAVSGVVVLALVILALVPVGREPDTAVNVDSQRSAASTGGGDEASAAVAAGASAANNDAAVAPAAGSGSGSASTTNRATGGGPSAGGSAAPASPATGAGADVCAALTASAPGITPKEVKLTVTTISLAGPIGNSTFDLRPDLPAIVRALAADINSSGGVACGRKLVVKQFDVNPLDPNDGQAKCLQAVQEKPFVNIDFAGYLTPASRTCFVQAKLPVQTAIAFSEIEAKASYPYVYGPRALAEQQAYDGILGLRDRGFFAAPKFQKLGLFRDGCLPNVDKAINAALAKVGVKQSQVSRFELACSSASGPNQIAQAALQHKLDGASHVFLATSVNNSQNYVRLAVGQDFHPTYGGSDYGEIVTAAGNQNWDRSFDGTVGITNQHIGEWNSGIRNEEIQRCDAAMKRQGVPGFSSEAKDTSLIAMCDMFSFFKTVINKAGGNPSRLGLVQAVGTIGLFRSANVGDGIFDRPGKISGGDFQRPLQFHASCTCWKVLDPAYKRGYPR